MGCADDRAGVRRPGVEAARQERKQARVELETMLGLVEAMALAVVIQRLDRDARLFQSLLHALGLRHLDIRILAPGGEEHGHLNPVGEAHRGIRIEHGHVAAEPVVDPRPRGATLGDQLVVALVQVVDADVTGGALVQRRLLRHAHQRGVTAIAGSVDADPRWIGDALLDRPARGIGDVVLHLQPLLRGTRLLELATTLAGAAVVDL